MWEQIVLKAKEIKELWYEEGLKDPSKYISIGTENQLIKAISEEIKKNMDRIILNVLNGKQTRIDSKKILESIRERFIKETEENTKEFRKKMLDENK